MTTRVLVCGGRDYADAATLNTFLDNFRRDHPDMFVIEGGARGADRLAKAWRKERGVRGETFPARWSQFGRRAGPIRNREMLVKGEPDVVIAFPGGDGTANMIGQARAARVQVIEVNRVKRERLRNKLA